MFMRVVVVVVYLRASEFVCSLIAHKAIKMNEDPVNRAYISLPASLLLCPESMAPRDLLFFLLKLISWCSMLLEEI